MLLKSLREEVCAANLELPRLGLVAWTSGNVSGRDAEQGLVVIKPSGLAYSAMMPEDLVVLNLDGVVVDGKHGPSSDTASHLYVYRARADVHGMTHTHSTYATAFAAVGQGIPAFLTGISDEFGEGVPCGGYAAIGGTAIGEEIIRSIGESSAILMQQHGVFTIGRTVEHALKAAVMVEDSAKTVAVARTLGTLAMLPDDEIRSNYERYHTRYGGASASLGVT